MTKILLVEDNEMNRDMLSRRLIKKGFILEFAHDGAQSIDMTKKFMPDIILMDMKMPVMDGWEATQKIRSIPSISHIPIIALTAQAIMGDRERCLEVGCDDYETKPVDMKSLLSKIESLLNRNTSPKQGEQLERRKKSRVLLVQSDAQQAQEELILLNSEYVHAEYEGNGLKAVKKIWDSNIRNPYDVIVLDIDLPDLNGFEILEALRETFSNTKLPILCIANDIKDGERAVLVGANEFILKPYSSSMFVHRIKGFIEYRRAHNGLHRYQTKLHLLASGLPILFWTTDKQLTIETLLGGKMSELQIDHSPGMKLTDIISKHAQNAETIHHQALSGESVKGLVEIKGQVFEAHIDPIADEDGAIQGTICVAIADK